MQIPRCIAGGDQHVLWDCSFEKEGGKLQFVQIFKQCIQNIFRQSQHWSQGFECHAICLLNLFVVSKAGKIAVDDGCAYGIFHDGGDGAAGAEGLTGDQFGVFPCGDTGVASSKGTVYGYGSAGDVAGHVAGKEQGEVRAFSGIAHAFGGAVLFEEGHGSFARVTKDRGAGVTGTDGVDGDPVLRIVHGGHSGHTYDTELCCGVEGLTTLRHETCNGSYIDQEATLAFALENSFGTILHTSEHTFAV